MSILKSTLVAVLAASTLGATIASTTTPAAARGWGAPVAAGVIGGLAAGAIIGSAVRPAYGYGYYGAQPYGYDPVPVYDPCYRSQQPVYDPYGNFAGYRTVRVCN